MYILDTIVICAFILITSLFFAAAFIYFHERRKVFKQHAQNERASLVPVGTGQK